MKSMIMSVFAGLMAGQANAESIFMDKEHLDIHFNKNVGNMSEVVEESDSLILLYLMHSEVLGDAQG